MTTVTKEAYWPTILADRSQLNNIKTSDSAFNRRAVCVYEVLQNTLLSQNSEDFTTYWERTLNITPEKGATLADRKAAVLFQVSDSQLLTAGLLKRTIEKLLGEGKVVVEALPAENKLVVHTDRADESQMVATAELIERTLPKGLEVTRYNHNMEISWRDINKYADCTARTDVLAVNPDYKKDLTSDGEWVYLLSEMEDATQLFAGAGSLRKLHIKLPKATSIEQILSAAYGDLSLTKLEDVYIYAPAENLYARAFLQSNFGNGLVDIKKLKLDLPNALNINNLFHSVTTQTSLEIYCPRITSASGAFIGLKLDKPSVLNIFAQLQPFTSGSHPLTIGIHVDHETDEEVQEAIANAESKGWTLTVQWNGTPTAQTATTYGLCKPPIYARIAEMELPDGTTERYLDWGHYVTDPTGYEEFSSVEEAREHFGLEEDEI